MENVSEFFEMGGYAAFIWPAYAISVVVLAVVLVVSLKTLNKAEAELDRLAAQMPDRTNPTESGLETAAAGRNNA